MSLKVETIFKWGEGESNENTILGNGKSCKEKQFFETTILLGWGREAENGKPYPGSGSQPKHSQKNISSSTEYGSCTDSQAVWPGRKWQWGEIKWFGWPLYARMIWSVVIAQFSEEESSSYWCLIFSDKAIRKYIYNSLKTKISIVVHKMYTELSLLPWLL